MRGTKNLVNYFNTLAGKSSASSGPVNQTMIDHVKKFGELPEYRLSSQSDSLPELQRGSLPNPRRASSAVLDGPNLDGDDNGKRGSSSSISSSNRDDVFDTAPDSVGPPGAVGLLGAVERPNGSMRPGFVPLEDGKFSLTVNNKHVDQTIIDHVNAWDGVFLDVTKPLSDELKEENWELYKQEGCPSCDQAFTILEARTNLPNKLVKLSVIVDASSSQSLIDAFKRKTRDRQHGNAGYGKDGHTTWPKIIVNGNYVGGLNNLRQLLRV
jgi:glutaredoxin